MKINRVTGSSSKYSTKEFTSTRKQNDDSGNSQMKHENVKTSTPIQAPATGPNIILRGEYLEAELARVNDPDETYQLYTIEFDIKDAIASGLSYIKDGCLKVYLEVIVIPIDRIESTSEQ